MPVPLLLDLTHTSHTRARTGIQRVTRSLRAALGSGAIAITHDPHQRTWRMLQSWEEANLAATAASGKRGAAWPLGARLRGVGRRLFAASAPASLPASSGLIVPEVFSPSTATALPALFAATTGPRVALFHDAIALKFPELTPGKTVARFPPYLRELIAFDGIAAVSEDSRDTLRDYWRWLGVSNPPPIQAIPLGVDLPPVAALSQPAGATIRTPTILSVGSLEGRKNHVALLEACERLWQAGADFDLHLIGLAHPQTGQEALARVRSLQASGRSLRYDGPATDAELDAAYAECAFTVYPSLIEGFGLPVIESLSHGKPCICSARGALGESTRDGGCAALKTVDADALEGAIRRLLTTPQELARLATEARARKFRPWSDYSADITAWMSTLPRRG
jgi:glycosyltransferase involved in cell wall biosynthesis